jgi:NADPH2:quinone reductase
MIMRAVWYETAGAAADVLEFGEMGDPRPGAGEVRARVAWSAVNPTDVKRRQIGRELGRFERIVPNNDGSGVIDMVGDGVPESRIGERVWFFGAQARRPFGSAADYCLLPSRQAIRLPDETALDASACLGVPAVTAHWGLFSDGPVEGCTVLVTGAAGRVGRYAVQIAKWAGARVIGTVGSDEKAAHVNALGADIVLDYGRDDIVGEVAELTGGAGVDRIVEVEFGLNIGHAPALVKPNGVVASYASDGALTPALPFNELMYRNVTLRPFSIYSLPVAAQDRAFADITACLAAGVLHHHVGRRAAFGDMVAAHQAIEAGLWGTMLVAVGSEGKGEDADGD